MSRLQEAERVRWESNIKCWPCPCALTKASAIGHYQLQEQKGRWPTGQSLLQVVSWIQANKHAYMQRERILIS